MEFGQAFKNLLKAEGGYSNHPLDSGGETIFGISRKFHPTLTIWYILDSWKENGTPISELTKMAKSDGFFMERIKAFYRGCFWNSAGCEFVPDNFKYPLFSCAVNCGVNRAIKLLQKTAGVCADGKFGTKTKAAVQNADIQEFYRRWGNFYKSIVQKNPTQKVFLTGWLNRIKTVGAENGDTFTV